MSNTLLEDLEIAMKIIAEKDEKIATQHEKIVTQHEQIDLLKARVAWLERHLFGPSSEKSTTPPPPPSGPQLDLFCERGEATAQEIREEVSEPREPRRRAPKKPFPKELPRRLTLIDLTDEEKVCTCCGGAKHRIGEDKTENLQVVPARVFVEEIVRPRYACPTCKEGITQAALPAQLLPRTNAGASLLSFLLLSKYADHLPLCRLERIFDRHGIDLPRRKTSEWMMELAGLLKPLVILMQRRIIKSAVIGADETSLQVLDPGSGKGKTRTSWLWVYRGDETAPYTVFDYQASRGLDGPSKILQGFAGTLVSDAYGVYPSLQSKQKIPFKRSGCWTHARRKFVDAARIGDARADEVVGLIGKLYEVEREAREAGLGPDALQKQREERSRPVLGEIRQWFQKSLSVLPKSPLGKAIGYAEDNWTALGEFINDGRIPIDNNAVERAIRPVAIGRKNWLFAGSDRGAKAAAIFFSLIDSARRAEVNLWDYMTDLLARLPSHSINRLEELLPDRWQAPPKT